MSGHRFSRLSKGRTGVRGQMNKTESKYASELDVRKLAGEVCDYWFEPFSLRLSSPEVGQPARYTPDFMILMPNGETFIDDVKGSGLEDLAAIVRLKCAAELFPLWVFRRVKQQTKKNGGGWEVTRV